MKKRKLLAILTLLMGLTGIQQSQASSIISNNFKDNYVYQISDIESEIIKKTKSNNYNNNQDLNNITFVNNFLDEQIQNRIFLYLKNEISLTSLKKDFKNNLQKRKKIHKELVDEYNNNLQSKEYLSLITNNGLKIDKISKLKKLFFTKILT